MSAQKQMIALDEISEENAPAIYVAGGLNQFLVAVQAEVSAEVPELTTRKGRDRIASLAAKVSKSKVAVEKPGREYLARLKEMPKVVEAELREFVRAMDTLRDETRRPLTEWEEAEARRTVDLQARIDSILVTSADGRTAADISTAIAIIEGVEIGADWEEFEAEAHRVKAASLSTLREALAKQEKHEAEQAELERLRAEAAVREQKEREERIAREAAEAERVAAEQRAQAEREAVIQREADAKAAAEKRELELLLQAEHAEREKVEAQRRAEQAERDAAQRAEQSAADERKRQADELAEADRQAKAREADTAHKAAFNNEALAAFIAGGMPEDCAKQAVTMIAKRQIPHISISY